MECVSCWYCFAVSAYAIGALATSNAIEEKRREEIFDIHRQHLRIKMPTNPRTLNTTGRGKFIKRKYQPPRPKFRLRLTEPDVKQATQSHRTAFGFKQRRAKARAEWLRPRWSRRRGPAEDGSPGRFRRSARSAAGRPARPARRLPDCRRWPRAGCAQARFPNPPARWAARSIST